MPFFIISRFKLLYPRKIKGFRDIPPANMQLRMKIIEAASSVYELFGFKHYETPILEYAEMLGKFLPDTDSVEEGVYSFRNPEPEPLYDYTGKELRDENDHVIMENQFLALRYDLTAPLARLYSEDIFMGVIKNQIVSSNPPLFRRYQYGPVFRFEAKLDPGRFREFWQLDFDTVGSADVATDAEATIILAEALQKIGLNKEDFTVKINNRKLLKGLLASAGVVGDESETAVLRVLDKVDKIGINGVEGELGKGREDLSGAYINGLNLDSNFVNKITGFLEKFSLLSGRLEVLTELSKIEAGELFTEGLSELEKINLFLESSGYPESLIEFSPALVRGMGYYTGPVFEVESSLTYKDSKGKTRKVGSICGGGRYDGLVEKIVGMRVPATGASIGVDRLAELLTLTGAISTGKVNPVLIVAFDAGLMHEYQKIASELRSVGIATEVYYGMNKNLKKQLGYADKNAHPLAVLMGSDEYEKGIVTLRDLRAGAIKSDEIKDKEEWKKSLQFECSRTDLVTSVKNLLEKSR